MRYLIYINDRYLDARDNISDTIQYNQINTLIVAL